MKALTITLTALASAVLLSPLPTSIKVGWVGFELVLALVALVVAYRETETQLADWQAAHARASLRANEPCPLLHVDAVVWPLPDGDSLLYVPAQRVGSHDAYDHEKEGI